MLYNQLEKTTRFGLNFIFVDYLGIKVTVQNNQGYFNCSLISRAKRSSSLVVYQLKQTAFLPSRISDSIHKINIIATLSLSSLQILTCKKTKTRQRVRVFDIFSFQKRSILCFMLFVD